MAELILHRDLIESCKAGDPAAQYRLYNMYSKSMYNTCLRMMKTKQEAEDVLQNAFVDVFMKIDQYGFQSTPGAWIKRIVINNCLNQLKKKRVYFDDIDNVGDFKEEASILPDNNLTVERVQCNMKKLSEGYRTVLNLYLMEGYDHKEIAQILNITESTSKTQYFRAKKKLKMLMVDTNAKHA